MKTKMKLIPIANRVLVLRPDAENKTKSGILLPDMSKEKPLEGVVDSVGWPSIDNLKHTVKPGDTVLMPKYGGSEVLLNGNTYTLIEEPDIMGILVEVADLADNPDGCLPTSLSQSFEELPDGP